MSLDSIWISIWLLKVGAIVIILRFLIRENQIKSGKNQGIWLLKMCGHPALDPWLYKEPWGKIEASQTVWMYGLLWVVAGHLYLYIFWPYGSRNVYLPWRTPFTFMLQVCNELDEEKHKHAQDTAQGDDVTYMLEKERERLKQEVSSSLNSLIVQKKYSIHFIHCLLTLIIRHQHPAFRID